MGNPALLSATGQVPQPLPLTLHARQRRLLPRSAVLRPPQAGRHLLLRQAQPQQRLVDLLLQVRIEMQVSARLLAARLLAARLLAALPAAPLAPAMLAAPAGGCRLDLLCLLSRRLFLGRAALGLRTRANSRAIWS